MEAPLISVIIATHGRPWLVQRALASVHAQGQADVQVIVVSDEADPATCLALQAALGPHDVFISRRGASGPAQSRNLGLQIATGRFILFLDDDDTFAKGFFDSLRPHLASNPHDILYVDPVFVDEERTPNGATPLGMTPLKLGQVTAQEINVKNRIPNNCLIYPRAALQHVRYDTELVLFEDWEFLINATQKRALRHLPLVGPCVHKNDRSKGERRGAQNDQRLLETTLLVYKKWPARTPAVKQARIAYLAQSGVQLPANAL